MHIFNGFIAVNKIIRGCYGRWLFIVLLLISLVITLLRALSRRKGGRGRFLSPCFGASFQFSSSGSERSELAAYGFGDRQRSPRTLRTRGERGEGGSGRVVPFLPKKPGSLRDKRCFW